MTKTERNELIVCIVATLAAVALFVWPFGFGWRLMIWFAEGYWPAAPGFLFS